MVSYAIDASAWIEYLEGSDLGKKVEKIIENPDNKIFTASVTLAEIISKFIRTNKDPGLAKKAIKTLSKVVAIDKTLAEETATIHAKIKRDSKNFGLADAFIIAMANSLNLTIVTKDSHFKHVKKTILLKE